MNLLVVPVDTSDVGDGHGVEDHEPPRVVGGDNHPSVEVGGDDGHPSVEVVGGVTPLWCQDNIALWPPSIH